MTFKLAIQTLGIVIVFMLTTEREIIDSYSKQANKFYDFVVGKQYRISKLRFPT